ncbi:MAG: RNA polymerase sigma-70 factor (ECF subfamily) [Verrucomicrobiales bacterium]|jgi:RNA polymerase sigma-70 factor (ECF subfamily)
MLTEIQQEEFARLWTEAQPSVSNYIHSLIRDAAAARDLVQETADVLIRKFADYNPDRPFIAWALGFAKFRVLGFHRDEARSFVTFDSELLDKFTESWAKPAPAVTSDRHAALDVCLEKLQGDSRKLLRFKYVEDLNSKEIGERLNRKSGSIRVTLQRIREQLKACVERRMQAQTQTSGGKP